MTDLQTDVSGLDADTAQLRSDLSETTDKFTELDSRTENIVIENFDGDDEILFNNDEDTESYAKIGQYGIKAKGFFNIDGTPLFQPDIGTDYLRFSDGEDITSSLETLIARGGDVYICGDGIAYIHKPIKISKNHTHIHISSNATLKLTDSSS